MTGNSSQPLRWVILDRNNEQGQWQCDINTKYIYWCKDSIVAKDSFSDLQSDMKAASQPDNGQMIVILFVSKDNEWPKITLNVEDKLATPSPWKAWCHYGGDISNSELETRWKNWDQIDAEQKKSLSTLFQDKTPFPFSAGRDNLPGSNQLLNLKKIVGKALGKGVNDEFKEALKLLQAASQEVEASLTISDLYYLKKEIFPYYLVLFGIDKEIDKQTTPKEKWLTTIELYSKLGAKDLGQIITTLKLPSYPEFCFDFNDLDKLMLNLNEAINNESNGNMDVSGLFEQVRRKLATIKCAIKNQIDCSA